MHRTGMISRRGMSLVEILVALVFLMFGLAGIVELYVNQARHLARTERLNRAESIARGNLAELQATGYDGLSGRIQSDDSVDKASLFREATRFEMDTDFVWNADLTKISIEGIPAVRVVVTCRWQPDVTGGEARGEESGVQKEVIGYAVAP